MLGYQIGQPANPCEVARAQRLFPIRPQQSRVFGGRHLSIPPWATIVPHITLSKKTNCQPSLEFYSDGCGEVRRVTIERLPFRIGRAETADLRVDSVEVSREHAEIIERNDMWLVRDLGSTNGTLVNGKLIKETLLSDGDILKVAETELTFVASVAAQFQRMVTQPIQSKKDLPAPSTLPPEVAAARMITEATLWQAIPAKLLAATSLRTGVTEAYFAPAAGLQQPVMFDQPHSVGDRYREIERLLMLELAKEQNEASRLFLPVGAAGIESPHRLFSNLKQLQAQLPTGWELGITISLPTDVDILRITDVYRHAQEHELLVAFDEFQGNGGQVMHLRSLLPDYLVLASNMTKDLVSNRQPLRRLESLLTACEELSIKPVLPSGESSHIIAMCEKLGFDLELKSTVKSSAPAAALSVPV
jgi:EAL domain-containing protein (putative c-di-GMP-specific phosphodiesterase class I)